MVKKYLPWILFAGLVIAPWTHRLLYENLRLAIPEAPSDGAHWTVIIGSVAVIWISLVWVWE